MTEPSPAPGTVLAGRFRVERVIGAGGMGVVLAATHLELDERVAIKMLTGPPSADALERLRREARAAARLRGEHVAHVKDFVVADDGRPILVMEYVSGRSVADELTARRTLPVGEAVGVILGACEGLAEAHAIGIVHRDIKPSNLMLTQRPDGSRIVKVLDFGVARQMAPGLDTLTQAEALLGSPAYMSPEQIRDPHSIDPQTDVWSLGVTLYQLLTGAMPFQAYSTQGVLAAVISAEPPPPRQVLPSLPQALSALVLSCLDKDAAKRPDGVAALATLLAPFADASDRATVDRVQRVISARAALYRTEAMSGDSANDEPTKHTGGETLAASRTRAVTEMTGPTKGPPVVPIAVTALVLALGVGVGWRLSRPSAPDDRAPASTSAAQAPTVVTQRSAPPPPAAPTDAPTVDAPPTSTRVPEPPKVRPRPSAQPAANVPPRVAGPRPVDTTDFGGR